MVFIKILHFHKNGSFYPISGNCKEIFSAFIHRNPLGIVVSYVFIIPEILKGMIFYELNNILTKRF